MQANIKYKYLVIGATSGIGLEIVKKLASQKNCAITIVGHNEERLTNTINSIKSYYEEQNCAELKEHIHAKLIDLSNLDESQNKFKELFKENPDFDGICYSAGLKALYQVHQLNMNKLEATLNTNSLAFIVMIKTLVRTKAKEHKCSVVYMSSLVNYFPIARTSFYSFTKGGINSFIRAAAAELLPQKIYINSISPACVDTPMVHEYKQLGEKEYNDFQYQLQPLGFIPVELIAKKTIDIMNPHELYTTGTDIHINAGLACC